MTTITPLERNRVNVTFTVVEGGVAQIRDIRIVGNTAFPQSVLLDQFEQTTTGWLTWYTKNDRYSRAKLNADLEKLRAFYTNRGFLDFAIESTQVTISPDKRDISITISVREGQPFTVSGVRLEGEFLGKEDEFKALVAIKPGEPYRAQDVADTVRLFGERFGLYGYAFARIEPRTEIDRATGQVQVVLVANPQRRVYVRRINVAGNMRTRDEVIRREFRQFEAAWYDGARIKLSRDRVNRLGYFTDVQIETQEVPGAPDQVDLTVTVVEKPTGNLMLGAGFSSSENVILSASISQQNLFGTGNAMTLAVNTGEVNRTYSLSFTNPYFTPDGIKLGWDVYHRNLDPTSLSVAPYKTRSTGAGFRVGYPIAEDDTIDFGLAVDRTEITTYETSPVQYKRFVESFGNEASSVVASAGWARDKRDSFLFPRRGTYQRAFIEAAMPPGELRYGKASYQHQYWLPVGDRYALMLNGDVGWAHGYGGKPMPFYKNFYAGGIGSVRGFDQSTLGPKIDGDALGGNRKLVGNVEFFFPMPGSGADRSLRLSTFVDVGNVWGQNESLQAGDLRYSTGVAFSWSSPLGPLKFSLGFPLNKKDDDEEQKFQFQFGSVF